MFTDLLCYFQSNGLGDVADKYRAFIVAEAVSPFTNATMHPAPPTPPTRPVSPHVIPILAPWIEWTTVGAVLQGSINNRQVKAMLRL